MIIILYRYLRIKRKAHAVKNVIIIKLRGTIDNEYIGGDDDNYN